MTKPAILAVDDDPQVLRAIERDLKRKYAADYRVLAAESGDAALGLLDRLALRGAPVALVLADQRMPGMSGVELLERVAQGAAPAAMRALLTAYADTDAAIQAINAAKVHYYLMKPWDPPESGLFPVLDDLLGQWRAAYRPPFEGVRVLGHRWSPRSHALRDFLGRNLVPFQWLDVEQSAEGRELLARATRPGAVGGDAPPEPNAAGTPDDAAAAATGATAAGLLPLVLFPDGTQLADPAPRAVAERVGLKVRAELPFYDLAIVGGGPAGLAAAVYGASEGLKTVLVEREAPGGQAGTSSRIENYLGFPAGLTGADLTRRAVAQVQKFGAELLTPQDVASVRVEGQYRVVVLADGSEISTRVLLVASGVSYRKLGVPGAESLAGAGVYYGASLTEAISCRDEDVYLVGAGNSAGQAAMHFAQYARRVTLVVRGRGIEESMSQYLVDQLAATPNVHLRLCTQVAEVRGDDRLREIPLAGPDGQREAVPASALFVFIGAAPRTDWLAGVVERDRHGFILTGPDLIAGGRRPAGWQLARDPYLLESSVPGIFVAGDVRHESVKRVASAVGEGAIAVQFTHRYLAEV